jgi:hypothetical protein
LLGEFAHRVADHNVGGSHGRPIMTAFDLRCAAAIWWRNEAAPPVIFELKRRFALSLVYQSIERQRITEAVYLAVAAPTGRKAWAIWKRKRGAVLQLCRRLGLGLMTVDARDLGPDCIALLLQQLFYRYVEVGFVQHGHEYTR